MMIIIIIIIIIIIVIIFVIVTIKETSFKRSSGQRLDFGIHRPGMYGMWELAMVMVKIKLTMVMVKMKMKLTQFEKLISAAFIIHRLNLRDLEVSN